MPELSSLVLTHVTTISGSRAAPELAELVRAESQIFGSSLAPVQLGSEPSYKQH